MSKKITIKRVGIDKLHKTIISSLWEIWALNVGSWTSPAHYIWVVFDGEDWVGYGCARIHDTDTVYLGPTWIHPNYRGNGLQLKLLKKREIFFRKIGIKYLISSTLYTNSTSGNNLIRAGFKLTKAWPGIDPEGLFWRKELC